MNLSSQTVPALELGDVLTPIATLIGLMAAALGLLVGARLDQIRIIVYIIVLIILFFVATSILTIAAAWSRSSAIWKLSVSHGVRVPS